MKVQLYIKDNDGRYINIPTYKDENISITSKVTDSEDISAIFNDISSSFSIPASDEVNRVFQNVFELGISISTNSISPIEENYLNKNIDAFIEIDTVPYKFGKVYIEGIDFEYNRPINYILNFAGNSVSIEDMFGDDNLGKLKLDRYNFDLSLQNVRSSINEPDRVRNLTNELIPYSIVTPLFLYTDRNVYYSPGLLNIDNIGSQTGSIKLEELRPGIRVADVFKTIQQDYSIKFYNNFDKDSSTFNSDIFNRPEFKNLYLWLNNNSSLFTDLNINISRSSFSQIIEEVQGNEQMRVELFGVNPGQNRIYNRIKKEVLPYLNLEPFRSYKWHRSIKVTLNSNGQPYLYNIKDTSGNIIKTSNGITTINSNIDVFFNTQTFQGNNINSVIDVEDFIDIHIESEHTITGTYTVENYLEVGGAFDLYLYLINRRTPPTNTLPTLGGGSVFDIKDNIPNITVSDFVKGIFKMFRLVLLPIDDKSFYLGTIDDLLYTGNTLNLNDFIDIKRSNIRKKLYGGSLNFKFEPSDLVMQKYFRENSTAGFDYGNEKLTFKNYDGSENIDVPFNNLLLSNISNNVDNPIVVGLQQEVDDDGVIKKSMDGIFLYYYNGNYTVDNPVYFNMFGNNFNLSSLPDINVSNLVNNKVYNSLTFGIENNPNNLYPKTNINLVTRFWRNWINTVYDKKYRKLEIEGVLPNHLIDKLKLNTKLVIDGYKYNIDEFKLSLLDNKLELSLYPFVERVAPTFSIIDKEFKKDETYDIIELPYYSNWRISLSSSVNWLINTESDTLNPFIRNDNKIIYKVKYNNSGFVRGVDMVITDLDSDRFYNIKIKQNS